MSLNLFTIDLETSIKNKGTNAVGKMAAAPWCKENKIIAAGNTYCGGHYGKYRPGPLTLESIAAVAVRSDMIVGQNLRFDLHYLRRHSEAWDKLLKRTNVQVWDTQLAEYILTGQDHMWASLNDLATKYGGTIKNDKIKEYWDNGIDTEDIPKEELMEYLKHDVLNTELVARAQIKLAEENGQLDLILYQMDALLATCEMEYNGMFFDKEEALEEAILVKAEYELLEASLVSQMRKYFPTEFHGNVNPNSNDQISVMLFGGKVKVKIDVPVLDEDGNEIVYKSGLRKGQVKTKKADIEMSVDGMGITPRTEWRVKKAGFYSTGDEVLDELATHAGVGSFCDAVLTLRGLAKDLKTYYYGYSSLVWEDGIIHGNLNHCATGTGRLSSSNPNLQNLTSYKED